MIEKIRSMFRQHVKPLYDLHDGGHQIDHADDVAREAMFIAKIYGLSTRYTELLMAASYLHDVGLSAGRDKHHIASYDYVKHNTGCVRLLDAMFTKDEQELIALACLEHRASFTGNHSSDISILVSCADRGRPDPMKYMRRSMAYNKTQNPLATDAVWYAEAKAHITDKYGREGYATRGYPEFFKEIYQKQLEVAFGEIDNL